MESKKCKFYGVVSALVISSLTPVGLTEKHIHEMYMNEVKSIKEDDSISFVNFIHDFKVIELADDHSNHDMHIVYRSMENPNKFYDLLTGELVYDHFSSSKKLIAFHHMKEFINDYEKTDINAEDIKEIYDVFINTREECNVNQKILKHKKDII